MKVACPNCKKEVLWDKHNEFRPFCSKQCQLIDLGEWAAENHSIPAHQNNLEEMQFDPEDVEALLSEVPDKFYLDE